MSKISELSDGGALQSTDYLIAVRSGGNVKVQANGAASFTTLTASGDVNFDSGTLFVDASADAVGIGTSSPARPLEVLGSGDTLVRITGGSGNAKGIEFYKGSGTATQLYNVSDDLRIFTNAAERIRLDSSGNLGLGVVPSAWGASYKALQFASGAITGFSTTALDLYGNAYDSGTGAWKYLNSSQGATRYAAFNGQHQWFNAPSGTAGNAISFTQAMTLDASGNLLVGTTTSPSDTGTVVADGIYLGGTGAANLLDDYEEGTWTPTIDAGASGFGGSPTVAGAYVKIGDLVHAKFFYENTWTTTGAALQIGGLPFTPSTSGTSWTAVGTISGSGVTINGSSVASVYLQIPLGGAEQYKVKGIAQDNTLAYLLTATTAKAIEGTLTYRAA